MNEIEKNELVKKLVEKVQMEEAQARALLEKHQWDILDCMLELERTGRIPGSDQIEHAHKESAYSTQNQASQEFQQVTVTASRKREESTLTKLKRILKKLFRKTLDNDFVVSRKEREVLRVPVLVPLCMLIVWFWITVIVFCIGLLTGFRYAFQGRDLGTEQVNHTMDQMASCAETIKVKVREFIDDENIDRRG